METDRTGSFEHDSMTNEDRKSIIIEKIEDNIREVKERLELPMSDKEAFKFIGKQDALERLKVKSTLYKRIQYILLIQPVA